MSLMERIASRLCREPGCKRAPAYPDQSYCADHRVKWQAGWRSNLAAKDMTRAA